MKGDHEISEADQLKAEYSTRMRDPLALNEWVCIILIAVGLTFLEDILRVSEMHGARHWGYWFVVLCLLLVATGGGKRAGRLAGYIDGYADGRKAAETKSV